MLRPDQEKDLNSASRSNAFTRRNIVDQSGPGSPTFAPHLVYRQEQSLDRVRPVPVNAQVVTKTRVELRKLLSLALQGLKERPRPPSAYEPHSETSRKKPKPQATTVGSVAIRGAVRLANTREDGKQEQSKSLEGDSDDEDSEHIFSTEPTFRALVHVRDTLVGHGKQIFSPE